MVQPDNFSLFQPLVLGSLWLAVRGAARLRPGVHRGGPAGRAGHARPERRRAGAGDARAPVRLGSLARLAVGRRGGRPPISVAAAVGCVGGLRPGHGAVVGAPAGRLRLALAVDRVGQGPVHPRHRRVEQHHDAGDPGPPARHGHRPVARHAARRARRRARDLRHPGRRRRCSRRSWSSAAGRAGDRRTSARSSSTPRSCSPSRRWSRRSTSRAARSSIRPSRWRRSPTSWRSKASPSPSPGSPPGARPGTRAAPPAFFTGAVIGFAVLCAVAGSLVVHAAWEGRRERGLAVAATLDAAGAPADATGSCRSTPRRPSTGPATAASSSSTTRSTPSRRSPRVRHPLARPRQGRLRPGRDAGHGRRAARLDRPADRRRASTDSPSTRWSPARDAPRGGPVRRPDLRGRARRPALVRGADPVPGARRTPPTTSASRATSSRAAASSPTPSGATRRRRSSSRGRRSRSGCRCRRSSPRSRWPFAGATFAASQWSAVVVGALVPVLAWRLAADVADGARPADVSGAGRWPSARAS